MKTSLRESQYYYVMPNTEKQWFCFFISLSHCDWAPSSFHMNSCSWSTALNIHFNSFKLGSRNQFEFHWITFSFSLTSIQRTQKTDFLHKHSTFCWPLLKTHFENNNISCSSCQINDLVVGTHTTQCQRRKRCLYSKSFNKLHDAAAFVEKWHSWSGPQISSISSIAKLLVEIPA
jgi:hypothetical protein